MSDLDALIAKLEAASEGSRELDEAIAVIDMGAAKAEDWRDAGITPNYSRSLDAAVSLVPDGMPVDIHIGPRGMGNDATVYEPEKWTDTQGRRCTTYRAHECLANRDRKGTIYWTPAPIALCVAALKALRARQDRDTPPGAAE